MDREALEIMHVLLVPVGSHGDVHPFVGLGLVLKERGHRVTFIIDGYFDSLIKPLGFETVTLSEVQEFEEALKDPDLWHPKRGLKAVSRRFIEGSRRVYRAIEERYVPGETVAVGGSLAFGMRMASEKLGLPAATLHLSPIIFLSAYETPHLGARTLPAWLPPWIKRRIFKLLFKYSVNPIIDPPVNTVRAELGLDPVTNAIGDWMNSPELVICGFPEWFGKPQPDWPAQAKLVGFPLYDERGVAPISDGLEAFLNGGSTPIAFTPGSANVHGKPFFEAAIDACLRLKRRGLLLTRHAEQIPSPLPEGIHHEPFAPFSLLLPRVAALVHHGGIGTSSQAMMAGIPQLIMNLAHDQFDNAARMERLGVARSILPSRFQGPRVAKLLHELIDSEQVAVNCREVAAKFDHVNAGLERAADLVESLGAKADVHITVS